MRTFLALFLLAGLSVGGFFGYRAWQTPELPVQYKTAEVKLATVISTVTATGTLEPLLNVLVGSQVSGTVVKWYADFNQEVKRGEILAELDTERIQANIAQREASVAVAKARAEETAARLSEASLELQRIERAFERSVASNFELESAMIGEKASSAALHAAQAQILVAEAELEAAHIELSKTIIRSPIDGMVISRDVDEGQTVAASLSAPTLFTIAKDLRKMRVNAAVSETDIGKVREGMEAQFRVDAYPGRKFRGVVTQVRFAETVSDNVVTYETLIDVDNPDLALRPGMTATVLFEVAKAEDVQSVPNAALRFDPNRTPRQINWRPGRGQAIKPRVYTLVDGRLNEVTVELGLNDGSQTQIVSGDLEVGDAVVIEQVRTGGGGDPRRMMRRM